MCAFWFRNVSAWCWPNEKKLLQLRTPFLGGQCAPEEQARSVLFCRRAMLEATCSDLRKQCQIHLPFGQVTNYLRRQSWWTRVDSQIYTRGKVWLLCFNVLIQVVKACSLCWASYKNNIISHLKKFAFCPRLIWPLRLYNLWPWLVRNWNCSWF